MDRSDVGVLIDYMYWVDWRILGAAERLSLDAWVSSTDVTVRDLRATLVHELDVESSWRLHLQGRGNEDTSELDPDDFPNVQSIQERWRQDEAEMRNWVASLTDKDIASDTYADHTHETRPLWQFLVHIVMHAMQQAADAATLLTLAGASPGELGLGEYLTARQQER